MGTFVGHIAPGTLLLVYGLCIYIYSIVLSNILSHPHTQKLVLPGESDKQNEAGTSQLSRLTRLMLNQRLSCIAYGMAITLAVIAAMVELIQWDFNWHHMTSPQHASMYGLVIMAASIGLLTSFNYLPSHSRWIASLAFFITGFMFYAHAQHGEFATAVHQIVAYLVWVIGGIWLVHNALHCACEMAICEAVHTEFHQLSADSASVNQSQHRKLWIISPTLSSLTVISGRITGFFLMLAGVWMYYIAFAMYSPFIDADAHHHDHDAHLLYMTLSWCVVFVASLGVACEQVIRFTEKQGSLFDAEYTKLCETSTEEAVEESFDVSKDITINHKTKLMKASKCTVDDMA